MTSATDTPSGVSRSYGFDANSNRCANATTCGSPTFSYNPGDQLTSSPYGSGYVYDTYGNLDTYAKTGGGTVNLDYDSFDHTIRIDDGTTRVDSVLSPDGRVLRRTVSSPPGVTITEDRWYGYTDSSDSPAWSQATSGGAYTTYLSNLVVTGTTPSYQVSDPKGTIGGTVTQAGAFSATPIPDEYGNIATVPASRLNWLGTQKRFVDHPGLDITRMGVRAYDPHIGRFLSQDPIAGGSANDYDYVSADPINNLDLGGTCTRHRGFWGRARDIGCHGGNVATKNRVARWTARHRWQVASIAVGLACTAASGGAGALACYGLGAALLGAKTYATYQSHGTARDFAWNVVSTGALMGAGAGWGAAAAELSGSAAIGARGMSQAPGLICGTFARCANPGLPR